MLKYITSNKDKIASARMNLLPFGLVFQEQEVDLLEMQSDSITEIAESKAKQAFEIIQQPLFVSDHGWSIPALRGFPGPYMKYMNNWLTSEDFLNLIRPYEDRTIIRHEVICYVDSNTTKLFSASVKGEMLHEISGEGYPAMRVTTLLPTKKSVASCFEEGVNESEQNSIWKEFAEWVKARGKL